jgi:hypothetical protein
LFSNLSSFQTDQNESSGMNRFRSHVLKPFEFGDAFPQNESVLKTS